MLINIALSWNKCYSLRQDWIFNRVQGIPHFNITEGDSGTSRKFPFPYLGVLFLGVSRLHHVSLSLAPGHFVDNSRSGATNILWQGMNPVNACNAVCQEVGNM